MRKLQRWRDEHTHMQVSAVVNGIVETPRYLAHGVHATAVDMRDHLAPTEREVLRPDDPFEAEHDNRNETDRVELAEAVRYFGARFDPEMQLLHELTRRQAQIGERVWRW